MPLPLIFGRRVIACFLLGELSFSMVRCSFVFAPFVVFGRLLFSVTLLVFSFDLFDGLLLMMVLLDGIWTHCLMHKKYLPSLRWEFYTFVFFRSSLCIASLCSCLFSSKQNLWIFSLFLIYSRTVLHATKCISRGLGSCVCGGVGF